MMKRLLLIVLALIPAGALAQTYLGEYSVSDTLYIDFATFDSDGASVTITGLATSDIEVYKNGNMTQRNSDVGFALTDTDGIDLDSTTGVHGFSIDLSDDTHSGFFSAGDQYTVVLNSITVDGQTLRPVWKFQIIADAWQSLKDGTTELMDPFSAGESRETTVSVVNSQTLLELAAGPSNDDALNNFSAWIIGGTEECERAISDYNSADNEIQLAAVCPDMTVEAGDIVRLRPGTSGHKGALAQIDLNTITGSDGALISSTGQPTDLISDITEMHDSSILATGTCDSGTTTTCVDATLTQGDDYWNYTGIVFQSGSNDNIARCVDNFDDTNNRLEFVAVDAAVTTEQYKLVFAPECYSATQIGVAGAGLTESGGTGDQFSSLNDLDAAGVRTALGMAAADLDTQLDALPTDADVNAQVDTALSDYDGPTDAEMDTRFDAIEGATFSGATDSLEAIRDRGDAAWTTGAGGSAPTAAEIVDEWESQSQLDPTGFHVNVMEVESADATNTINAESDTALADYDAPTKAELDSGLAALNDLDAAGVRTALGMAAADLDTQLDALPTDADVNAQVDTALSDYDGPTDAEMDTRFDAIEGATFSGATDSLEAIRDRGDAAWTTGAGDSAPTAAEIVDEWESQSQLDPTGFHVNVLEIESGDATNAINAEADTALADYDPPTLAELNAALAALNDLDAAGVRTALGMAAADLDTQLDALPTDADVNTQVDTALADYDAPTKAELDSGLAALNDLDAAGVRTALGMAAADLDTQLDALPTAVEIGVQVRDQVIDDQGSISLGCAIAATLARLAGDWSGTTSVVYQDATGTETRVTVDLSVADQRDGTITCPTY